MNSTFESGAVARSSTRHPLMPMEAAMVFLDCGEQDIFELIDRGELRWAFNIASPGAVRRELRLFRASVVDCQAAALRNDRTFASHQLTLDDVVNQILPTPTLYVGFQTIRCAELMRRFACSHWLIHNLMRMGEIERAPVRRWGRISPYVLHETAADFLKRRELKGRV